MPDLNTPTVNYICFQMDPLQSIFLSCVSNKIRLNMDLFRPFYPQIGRIGWSRPDSTTSLLHKSTLVNWNRFALRVYFSRVELNQIQTGRDRVIFYPLANSRWLNNQHLCFGVGKKYYIRVGGLLLVDMYRGEFFKNHMEL